MSYVTPSQRLRAVIYLLYIKKTRPETSEEFYKNYMEKIIDKVKEKVKDQREEPQNG
jgi:hypothetical protein